MTEAEYIQIVTDQIRTKKVHSYIKRELHDHICDQKEALLAEGYICEEDAEKQAIKEMGDPIDVGEKLDKIHRTHYPWRLLILVAAVILISLPIIRHLATLTDAIDVSSAVTLQSQHIVIGIMICAIVGFIDYRQMANFSFVGAVMIIVLLITALCQNIYGHVRIGITVFSAISLVPLYIVMYAGSLYVLIRRRLNRLLIIPLELLPVALLMLLNAYLPAIMLSIGELLIFIRANKVQTKNLYESTAGPLPYDVINCTILIAAAISATIIAHIQNGQDNYSEIVSTMWKIWRQSNLFGESNNSINLLKSTAVNPMTDYTFLGITALCGKIASLAIIVIDTLLVVGIERASSCVSDISGKLLCNGSSCAMLIQILGSVVSCFTSDSSLGVSVPIMSYGGTGLMINCIILGIALSVINYRSVTPFEISIERR